MLSIFLNSLFLLSHLLSPLFKPKHHPPPNINITHQSSSFFLVGCDSGRFFFFFCCERCLKEEVGMAGFLGCSNWWWVWWRSAWVIGFGGDRRASVAFSSWKSRNLIVEFISSAAPYCQRLSPPKIVIVHQKSRWTSRRYHCTVEIPQWKKPRLSLPVLDSVMHRFVIMRHYVFV